MKSVVVSTGYRVITTCALAVGTVACAGAPSRTTADPDASGVTSLRVPQIDGFVRRYHVATRRLTDSADRPMAIVTRRETHAAGDRGRAVFTTDWSPPFKSVDTLTVTLRDLAPVDEVLHFQGKRMAYRYDGAHVTGIISSDSASTSFDTTYDEPVYAFNEAELLVRSLDYREGLTRVVPLFSEVDRAVEHDTISVLGRASGKDGAPWRVRFADPAIVSIHTVDPRTRSIVETVTTIRKSGMLIRYTR